MIKIISSDIDGTLVNSNGELTPKTRNSLIAAQKSGIKLILASGRPTSGLIQLSQKLEMDKYNGYLISYNGSKITDCKTNETVLEWKISAVNVKAIIKHLTKYNVGIVVTDNDFLYTNNQNYEVVGYNNAYPESFKIIQHESRVINLPIKECSNLSEVINFSVNKIMVIANFDYLEKNKVEFIKPFMNIINGVYTSNVFFELTPIGIDKSFALSKLLPKLNIETNELIAFGDGHNDFNMLKISGIGVAMDNAVSDLKVISDFVTLSNENDGIAFALEKYLK